MRKCKVCGKEFSSRNPDENYCSLECKEIAHQPKKCLYCGNLFKPKRIDCIYCSPECRSADKGRKNKEYLKAYRENVKKGRVHHWVKKPKPEKRKEPKLFSEACKEMARLGLKYQDYLAFREKRNNMECKEFEKCYEKMLEQIKDPDEAFREVEHKCYECKKGEK